MIDPTKRFILDEETAHHEIGVRCHDCNTRWVVYGITVESLPYFEAGAYCYPCLLKRVKAGGGKVPLPMPEAIAALLEKDLMPRNRMFIVPEVKKNA